jgi:hypothetical protein
MRVGVLSDESVRRFCRTIERDDSTGPLARRLLATRSNRFEFTRRLAEATYTPEQLAVASPKMYAAMFERAAHLLTAPEGEVYEGYDEFEPSEQDSSEGEPDLESDSSQEEGFEEALEPFEGFTPLVQPPLVGPSAPQTLERRRRTTTVDPERLDSKKLNFDDPRDKRDISRPKVRAARTRSFMKNVSREQLIELYTEAYRDAYNADPGPLTDVDIAQLAE